MSIGFGVMMMKITSSWISAVIKLGHAVSFSCKTQLFKQNVGQLVETSLYTMEPVIPYWLFFVT